MTDIPTSFKIPLQDGIELREGFKITPEMLKYSLIDNPFEKAIKDELSEWPEPWRSSFLPVNMPTREGDSWHLNLRLDWQTFVIASIGYIKKQKYKLLEKGFEPKCILMGEDAYHDLSVAIAVRQRYDIHELFDLPIFVSFNIDNRHMEVLAGGKETFYNHLKGDGE